jgi:hypothetical protein
MKQSSAKSEKGNQATRSVGFVLLGLSVLVIAWLVFRPSAQTIPTLVTLEDKWDLLETSAYNLQNDAYLTSITISTDATNPYAMTAEYHSTSVPDKMIFVGIDRFNKIETGWVNIPSSGSGAQKPIRRSDWSLDSQEALSIFAKDEMVDACLKSSISMVQLSLNRVMTENTSWVLHIFHCPNEGEVKTDYLDAQTGERIDPFSQ